MIYLRRIVGESMEPKKGKWNLGDILFFLLLFGILLFLIPFYSSLGEIFWLAVQFEVGTDTYISILGFLLCVFILFLGIKHKNSITKIFSLLLAFVFLLGPFWGYFEDKPYLNQIFSSYRFKKIKVIPPEECELDKNVQEHISNKLEQEYGEDMHIDVETMKPTNTRKSVKDKIRCMPSHTHYTYLIEYKDTAGEKRTIVYDGKDTFYDNMLEDSFEITYASVGAYFKQTSTERNVSYRFYLYKDKKLVEMTRGNVISEKLSFPYPSEVSIQNFNQDTRMVLDITFSILVKQAEAHSRVEKLEEETRYPLHAIIHYGKTVEYYAGGKWYSSEADFLKKLEDNN